MNNQISQLIRQAQENYVTKISVTDVTIGEQIVPVVLPEEGSPLLYEGFKDQYGNSAIFDNGTTEFSVFKIVLEPHADIVRIFAYSAIQESDTAQRWERVAELDEQIRVRRPRSKNQWLPF